MKPLEDEYKDEDEELNITGLSDVADDESDSAADDDSEGDSAADDDSDK